MTDDSALTLNMAVAYQLELRRIQIGMTHPEIAEAAHLSTPAVERYLGGTQDIPLPAFSAIASALGVSPLDIFARAQRGMHG
ncbi:helix-turn-helix domain-containing protein [Microbacterium sp. P01]|uniref:helix-turn-helix domain-containing protein n=1 Tax=unclassified Microbacterium TaxID=2609290 RepID=UPI00366CD435